MRSIALDQDPEAVYFNLKGTWEEWDTRVPEDLVQLAAGQYVASILQPKLGRAGAEASPPASSSHCILAAPTTPGSEHTGQGTGG